ncbi:ParB/RepB/Spo0J family partition protein [Streptomyces sp. NPDC002932]|uniref:ParB/RepB/Spo0J family partition protein n=1 Tax=Streptomyces sp. NPDC002932 TaxID=3364672 RepID=UPI0036B3759A
MPRNGAGGSQNSKKMKDIPLRPSVAPREVSVDVVVPNPLNLREDDLWTDDQERNETVASLETSGVLQALLVGTLPSFLAEYPEYAHDPQISGAEYVIIAGHRRYAAARLAGLDKVRIDVRNELWPDLDVVMLEENLKRKGLSVFQEGVGYRRLAAKGMSHAAIAKRVGRGKSTITKRIALLDLLPPAREYVLGKNISIDSAYNLLVALDGSVDQFVEAAERLRENGGSPSDAVLALFATGSGRTEPDVPQASSAVDSSLVQTGPGEPVLTEPVAGTITEDKQTPQTSVPPARSEPVLPEPAQATAPPRPSAQSSASADSAQPGRSDTAENIGRARADAARNAHCRDLVANAVDLIADPRSTRIASMALAHATPAAMDKAHGWMKAADATDAEAFESESYRDAVLVRGDANLIARLAYAIALAQAELRASSRRRKWDYREVAHLRHLIDSGYEPTAWERRELG